MSSPDSLTLSQPAIESNSLALQIATLAAVVLPLAGFAAAIVSLWGWGFQWVDLGLLLVLYLLTGLGITVGFHRHFTHKGFETNAVVRFILAVLGSMAVQGSVLHWAAQHRRHHQHSDSKGDPHSPHHHGTGILGVIAGFWHAHIGWAFKDSPGGIDHYVADLRKSPSIRIASKLFPLWIALGLVVPFALGGLISGTWTGAVCGLLWGGFARVFLVHHVTWSVNSVCHLWGSRPYPEKDHSRNNLVFGVLALGEGWHNNHHAFPTSAKHGFRWWQVDLSYYVIRMLAIFGLAWNIRLPGRSLSAARNERNTRRT